MIQNTSTYERYELDSKSGQLIVLSPNLTNKVGPYFGWRWIFLGYTFDIKNISINTNNSVKKEFELSLYSSLFGIDFVYRRTGSDYKIRSINLGENINTNSLIGMPFKGINVGITGINVYYIFISSSVFISCCIQSEYLSKEKCRFFYRWHILYKTHDLT